MAKKQQRDRKKSSLSIENDGYYDSDTFGIDSDQKSFNLLEN